MSTLVDEKIVSMRFDSAQFERGVQSAIKTTNDLKKSLNFSDTADSMSELSQAASKVNMNPLLDSIKGIGEGFNAAGVVAFSVINRITNAAIDAGVKITKALTITPMTTGMNEYELKMGSIQTIMASTGADIKTVNKYLDELNEYSDKTIYSFADMTQNIGKFTNAGVELGVAVDAMRGLLNEAALSGANAAEASRAMYNLAQSISMGYVQLIDWKSIENANMATLDFKKNLAGTAIELGIVKDLGNDIYKVGDKTFNIQQLFKDGLKEQWLTTDVLTKTLKKYQDGSTELGKKAQAAAQDMKTFTQMMDTLREGMQSGWAQSWQLIFGDFEEAKRFWTTVGNSLNGLITTFDNFRNSILEVANALGMRENLLKSFLHIMNAIGQVLYSIKIAAAEAFGVEFLKREDKSALGYFAFLLVNVSRAIESFTKKLLMSKDAQEDLITILTALFSIAKTFISVFGELYGIFSEMFGITAPFGTFLRKTLVTLAKLIIIVTKIIQKTKIISGTLKLIGGLIGLVAMGIAYLVTELIKLATSIPPISEIFSGIGDAIEKVRDILINSGNPILQLLEKVFIEPFNTIFKLWKGDYYNIQKLPEILLSSFIDGFKNIGSKLKTLFSSDAFQLFTPIKNAFVAISDFIGKFDWKKPAKVAGIMFLTATITTLIFNITQLMDVLVNFGLSLKVLSFALADVMHSVASYINAQAFDQFTDSLKKLGIIIMSMAGLSIVFGMLNDNSFNKAMVALERLAILMTVATTIITSIWYTMTTVRTVATARSVDSFADAFAVIGKSFASGFRDAAKIYTAGNALQDILSGIAIAMIGIAFSMTIITDALVKCDVNKINAADVIFVMLTSLVGSVAVLAGMGALLSKCQKAGEVMDSMTTLLLGMSASVFLLAKGFELFAGIDPDSITMGLTTIVSVSSITAILSAVQWKMPADPKGILATAAVLVAFGSALFVLIGSFDYIHRLVSSEGIGNFIKDLIAMDMLMASFALSIVAISVTIRRVGIAGKKSTLLIGEAVDALSAAGLSAVILSMSAAIMFLTASVEKIGKSDAATIQNGLYYMTLMLAEFGLFLYVTAKTVAGSIKESEGFFLGIALVVPSIAFAISRIQDIDWARAAADIASMSVAILAMGTAVRLAGGVEGSKKNLKAFAGMSLSIFAVSASLILLTLIDTKKLWEGASALTVALLSVGVMFEAFTKIRTDKEALVSIASLIIILGSVIIAGQLASDPKTMSGIFAISTVSAMLLTAFTLFSIAIGTIMENTKVNAVNSISILLAAFSGVILSIAGSAAIITATNAEKGIIIITGALSFLMGLTIAFTEYVATFNKRIGATGTLKMRKQIVSMAILIGSMSALALALGVASKFAKGNITTIIQLGLIMTAMSTLLFAVAAFVSRQKAFSISKDTDVVSTLKAIGMMLLEMSAVMTIITGSAFLISQYGLIDEVAELAIAFGVLGIGVGEMMKAITKNKLKEGEARDLSSFYTVAATMILGMAAIVGVAIAANVNGVSLGFIGTLVGFALILGGAAVALSKALIDFSESYDPEKSKTAFGQFMVASALIAVFPAVVAGLAIAFEKCAVTWSSVGKIATVSTVGVAFVGAAVGLLVGIEKIAKSTTGGLSGDITNEMKSLLGMIGKILLYMGLSLGALVAASMYTNDAAKFASISATMVAFFGSLELLVLAIIEMSKRIKINTDLLANIGKMLLLIVGVAVVLTPLTAAMIFLSNKLKDVGKVIEVIGMLFIVTSALSALVALMWAIGELMTAGGIGWAVALAGLASVIVMMGAVALFAAALELLVNVFGDKISKWGPFIDAMTDVFLRLSLAILSMALTFVGLPLAIAGLTFGIGWGIMLGVFLGVFSLLHHLYSDKITDFADFSVSLAKMMVSLVPAFIAASSFSVLASLSGIGITAATAAIIGLGVFLTAFSAVVKILNALGLDSGWLDTLTDFGKGISSIAFSLLPAFAALSVIGTMIVGVKMSISSIIAGLVSISLLLTGIWAIQKVAQKVSPAINWLVDWIIELSNKLGSRLDTLLTRVSTFLKNLSRLNLFSMLSAAFLGAGASKIFRLFTGKTMFGTIGEELAAFVDSMKTFVNSSAEIKPANWIAAENGIAFIKSVIDAVSDLRIYEGSLLGKLFGTNDLTKLAEGLTAYAISMFGEDGNGGYLGVVKGLSPNVFAEDAPMVKAIEFLQVITDAMRGFKWTDGSVIGSLFGNNDFGNLLTALPNYAVGLMSFANVVGAIDESSYPAMEKALSFLPMLGLVSMMTFNRDGSLLGFLIGGNDFGRFGPSLEAYGKGLAAYSKAISGISNWENMDKGLDFLIRLSTLTLEIALNVITILGIALITVASSIAAALLIIFYSIDEIVTSHQGTFDKIIDNLQKLLENGLQDIFDLLNSTIADKEWLQIAVDGIVDITNALTDFIKELENLIDKIIELKEAFDEADVSGNNFIKTIKDNASLLKGAYSEWKSDREESLAMQDYMKDMAGANTVHMDPKFFIDPNDLNKLYDWIDNDFSETYKEAGNAAYNTATNSFEEGMNEARNKRAGSGNVNLKFAMFDNTRMALQASKVGELCAKYYGASYEKENASQSAHRHSRAQAEAAQTVTLSEEAGEWSGIGFGTNLLTFITEKIADGLDYLKKNLPSEWKGILAGIMGMTEDKFDEGLTVISNTVRTLSSDPKGAISGLVGNMFDIDEDSVLSFLNGEKSISEMIAEATGLNGDDPLGLDETNDIIDEKEEKRLLSENAYWAQLLEIKRQGADGAKYIDMDLADFQEEILSQTQEMYDNYLSGLENSYSSFMGSSIFSAVDMGFDPENPFTKDEMFGNLQDQINQLDRYTNVMNSLNDRIDTDELRKTINSMGVDSIEELETLNSLSEAELDSYEAMYVSKMEAAHRAAVAANDQAYRDTVDGINSLIGTSLDGDSIMQMFDGTMASLDNIVTANQARINAIGADITAGVAEGMVTKGGLDPLDPAAATLYEATDTACRGTGAFDSHSPARAMYPLGHDITAGIAVGMTDGQSMTQIKASSALVAAWYKSELQGKYQNFVECGRYLMRGLREGIDEGRDGVLRAIKTVSDKMMVLFTDENGIESPSKVYAEFGRYIDEGLANGILNNTGATEDAMSRMSNQALGIMQDSLAQANDAMNSKESPSLTPVVNLDRFQNGLRSMDSALANQRSYLMANAAMANIDTSVNREINVNNSGAVSAIQKLNNDMILLGDRLAQMQIVLDSGIMAGQMAPAMDSELGTLMMRSMREGAG